MTRKRGILLAVLGLAVAFGVWWDHGGQAWFALHTGTDNCNGVSGPNIPVCKYYGFWSGFGSDLGEYVIIAALLAHLQQFWVSHTCRARWWCWRPGTHAGDYGYKYCHVHHPDDIPSAREAVEQAATSPVP